MDETTDLKPTECFLWIVFKGEHFMDDLGVAVKFLAEIPAGHDILDQLFTQYGVSLSRP